MHTRRRRRVLQRPARLPAPQRHDTTCTECGRPIEGVRFGVRFPSFPRLLAHSNVMHTCLQCTHSNCEHVSICAPCEAHPIPSHPRGHALVKYRVPGVHPDTRGDRSSAMAAGPRHPAGCDSCGQPIFGVRYKVRASHIFRPPSNADHAPDSVCINSAPTSTSARRARQMSPHGTR